MTKKREVKDYRIKEASAPTGGIKMKKNIKSLADWKKEWQNSTDLQTLKISLDNIDELYDKVRGSIGRMLMSMEMIEIQEIIEDRIEELSKNKVAA